MHTVTQPGGTALDEKRGEKRRGTPGEKRGATDGTGIGATVGAPAGSATAAAGTPLARVAVAGATGFTGQELLRLLSRHPAVVVTAAMSSGQAGGSARRLPALSRLWNGTIVPLSPETLARDADVVFLALPDAAAAELAPALVDAGVRVIDLSGAFRLSDDEVRGRWYPETHRLPDGVAYGLTERERGAVARARLVANPGCYPTAALLALAPLADAGLLLSGADIIVDAKSGVSGAGKTPSERTHFSEVHGSMSAYGVFSHRHGAEIEQGLGRTVTFTPHLVPLDRGIFSTIYVRVAPGTTEETFADVYERAYEDAAFVRLVGSSLPEIKHVAHTNFCDIGWRVEPSGRAILVSVIDNLLKGASGQAVQNLNVMLGIDERTALL
jgi:N-acetyl-gamma-glutamyl-phosphate reductase